MCAREVYIRQLEGQALNVVNQLSGCWHRLLGSYILKVQVPVDGHIGDAVQLVKDYVVLLLREGGG